MRQTPPPAARRATVTGLTMVALSAALALPLAAGEIRETFIAEHEGWRVFHNVHESGAESCLAAVFDGLSSFIAVAGSDQYVHFLVRTGHGDRGGAVMLMLPGGTRYPVTQNIVDFPTYEARADFIDEIWESPAVPMRAVAKETGATLATFPLTGAGAGFIDLVDCMRALAG